MTTDAAPGALERLLGDVESFAGRHWGRRPLVCRGQGEFDDLLDVDAIEAMLTGLGRRPTFRLVRSGCSLPPVEYTVRTRVGGVDVDDVADVDRIVEFVAAGATLVLQGLQRTWAPLRELCQQLEAVVNHPVQANAYLSPPSTIGLGRHADRHDVIVVQVTGRKSWDVATIGELELEAGDVMYLPAGTEHAALTTSATSLHVTLGIMTRSRRDVLRRVLDSIPALDEPLPMGFATDGVEALAAAIAAARDDAVTALAQLDVAAVSAGEVRRYERRRSRGATGRLAVAADPHALGHETTLARRPGLALRVGTDDDGRAVLSWAAGTLRLPPFVRRALDVVASAPTFTAGNLRGLDADSQLVLARRLVREGVVTRR